MLNNYYEFKGFDYPFIYAMYTYILNINKNIFFIIQENYIVVLLRRQGS